ncbi:MAG: relaxase/mobilization nuclease domain-containing protein [Alphaproteobacteria bacterium]|nr:relaxase/mobilization nuclease domain-containing protein [Alphaproteobacteria bacterium]
MIIKSHIRGGYRAAADYLKEVGKNEQIRLVQISDPDARNLDEAFHNMWTVACNSKVKKPLHHISINPFKDERLTDEQVLKIIERAEQKYGYKPNEHQRVIVEHILNGRQHFHVMWNRVSLKTGKAVWPGEHWKKSKQVCREMEKELGLKSPTPRHVRRMLPVKVRSLGFKARRLVLFAMPNPAPPYWILPPRPSIPRYEVPERPMQTVFPSSSGSGLAGMSEAQRIDFIAACDGKITWRQYFEKWGDGNSIGPSS